MELTKEQVYEMNIVQKDIMAYFISVCEKLNLKYYMVHGSLLGTLMCEGFFPFDDDIDVAMPRKDYDILLREGQKLLPKNLFLQSCKSEKDYPLAFTKIRNSDTAFVQTIMKNFDINQGIYIDIFPIDNYPENSIRRKWLSIKEQIYKIRINTRVFRSEKQPVWKTLVRLASMIICPSWEIAVQRRANLYASLPASDKCITIGGKCKERGIPQKWFGEGRMLKFEDMEVCCPTELEKYLTCIYGDYKSYNPAAEYLTGDGKVVVSAELFSTNKPYNNFDY